jgi:Arc/MetJ-type ribon-helix-helix transcriptional regulator
MGSPIHTVVQPLIQRKIFETEAEAVRELVRAYVLRQIADLQEKIAAFEREYGMSFAQFADYLHERSALLTSDTLSAEQRRVLGQAVMQEEDDWLEWKATQDILESWLGLPRP